jgi:hypothetical protein
MRLLSGARGLLSSDPDMQAAARAELESPNPDLSLFRAWGTASVSIAATAIRALDGQSPPAVRSPSPLSPTRQAEMAGRATLELPTSGAAPVATAAPPHAPRAAVRARPRRRQRWPQPPWQRRRQRRPRQRADGRSGCGVKAARAAAPRLSRRRRRFLSRSHECTGRDAASAARNSRRDATRTSVRIVARTCR